MYMKMVSNVQASMFGIYFYYQVLNNIKSLDQVRKQRCTRWQFHYDRRFTLVEEEDGTSYSTQQKWNQLPRKSLRNLLAQTKEDENPDDDMEDHDQPLVDYMEDEDVDDMMNPNSGEDQTKDTVQGETEYVLQAPIVEQVAAALTQHIEVIAARMWCF